MDQYVTGAMIRQLREEKKMTQLELAERISVSDKTVSKWETGRGYPDITLVEPLADALGISVIELMAGENVKNTNRSFNMNKVRFYICPICGNVICSTGEAVISCCGIKLIPAEVEEDDHEHIMSVQKVEDEYYVTIDHEMTKEHYISFIAAVRDNSIEMVRLYPEGEAAAGFKVSRTSQLCCYCNRHGLYKARVRDLVRGSEKIRD